MHAHCKRLQTSKSTVELRSTSTHQTPLHGNASPHGTKHTEPRTHRQSTIHAMETLFSAPSGSRVSQARCLVTYRSSASLQTSATLMKKRQSQGIIKASNSVRRLRPSIALRWSKDLSVINPAAGLAKTVQSTGMFSTEHGRYQSPSIALR